MADNIIEDFQDDTYSFAVINDPTYPWTRSSGVAPNGVAGYIASTNVSITGNGRHNTTSQITFDINVPTGTTRSWIEVDYAISSEENYDFLNIGIDGVTAFSISGIRSGTFTQNMTAGLHKLRLAYVKDVGVVAGDDKAYVSSIRLMHEQGGVKVKIAELRLGSGDYIPLYDISGNGDQLARFETSEGTGFAELVPLNDPAASRVRVHTQRGTMALAKVLGITFVVWDGGLFTNTAFPRSLDGGTFTDSTGGKTADGGTF